LTWYIRRRDDWDEDDGRRAVDKNIKVRYEDGMTENTQAIDLVHEILAATFGPNTAAEVVKDDAAEADAPIADRPSWWRKNLDGSWRKRCQAPDVLKGFPHGETRQRETDLLVLKALHAGAESLVQLMTITGFVKVTCTRSLERLVEEGRVVQTKAPPSGRRGRPAHLYRPTTEVVEPVTPSADADVVVEVEGSGVDLRSTFVPDTAKVDAGASTLTGVEE